MAITKEEIIRATELQRNYRSVLDRAAKHPVSVSRDSGDDVTLVSRDRWQDAHAAFEIQTLVAAIGLTLVRRLEGGQVTYPVELSWLRDFDNEELIEFGDEFFTTLDNVRRRRLPPNAVEELIRQWEASSAAATDRVLQTRFSQARKEMTARRRRRR